MSTLAGGPLLSQHTLNYLDLRLEQDVLGLVSGINVRNCGHCGYCGYPPASEASRGVY